ncbi:hypothetical protein V8J88_13765 [Massilia sp. W12]
MPEIINAQTQKTELGASLESLGLEVVDNDDLQIALARPVRHIRAMEPGL